MHVQIPDVTPFEPGQALNVEELFKEGDLVDIAGTSIGKGFQGMLVRFVSMNVRSQEPRKCIATFTSAATALQPSNITIGHIHTAAQQNVTCAAARHALQQADDLEICDRNGVMLLLHCSPLTATLQHFCPICLCYQLAAMHALLLHTLYTISAELND